MTDTGPPASNAEWFARARRVIPGGVDSPVRSFASVGGTPYTVVQGHGPYIVDAEGTPYIDLVQSYGAVLLGHAHPLITAAVTRAAGLGTTFGAPTPGEVLLAEAICDTRARLRTDPARVVGHRGGDDSRSPGAWHHES